MRTYREATDLLLGATATANVNWTASDELDPPYYGEYGSPTPVGTNLYTLDAVAYESILVGLLSLITGKHTGGHPVGREGEQDAVFVAFSRDGFHWWRPLPSFDGLRTPFLPMSAAKADWNFQNVQSAGGGFLTLEDELRFFVGGRSGTCEGIQPPRPHCSYNGNATTGFASLRRDGFASLLAFGPAQTSASSLTTRPLSFNASRIHQISGAAGGSALFLFVNADVSVAHGCLTVQVVDETTREPLARLDASTPLCAINSMRARVDFPRAAGGGDLAPLAHKPFRLRFTLTGKGSRLYSFWVGTKACGESRGYVAAGSSSFNRTTDVYGLCT